MSNDAVRSALETALAAMTPALATSYENDGYTPVAGTPYQRCNVLFARPVNDEISASYVEQGFMQVTLFYPPKAGAGAAQARAKLLRSTFYRGRTLTPVGGIATTILFTPEIMPGSNDADRYSVPVRIPFRAPVTV